MIKVILITLFLLLLLGKNYMLNAEKASKKDPPDEKKVK